MRAGVAFSTTSAGTFTGRMSRYTRLTGPCTLERDSLTDEQQDRPENPFTADEHVKRSMPPGGFTSG